MNRLLRLGIVRVYREESWPSMDLCADQLMNELKHQSDLVVGDISFQFRRRFQQVPSLGSSRFAFNADRILNRHHDLVRELRTLQADYDWFHITDHSYAMAGHGLPRGRFGIYCHDLDAFRCLLNPSEDPRAWWFRRLTRRLLNGFQKASVVFHSTLEVREQILASGLISQDKLIHAPYGVSEEFIPEGKRFIAKAPYLLHVGSEIPRKRLDVLLEVFASVRKSYPALRLIQIGGTWTSSMKEQIETHRLADSLEQRRGLCREELAALYRGSEAVLVTSEAEGFGLPVIEALGCGATVIASDLPVLREVGGDAVIYRPVGEVAAWTDAVSIVLNSASFAPARELRIQRARLYSWAAHAKTIAETYQRLAQSRLST